MPLDNWIDAYEHDPEKFDFEAFKAEVKREHGMDMSGANAKIEGMNTAAATIAEEVRKLKERNWDLLQQVPSDASKNLPNKLIENNGLPEGEHYATIDDLFKPTK